ncbi:hypothetical protein H2201_002676 [Coniosporium apollinis]|uniref:Uncharacterized protein n=2 Tax=Coniosporium TaxID=2810619 RepID=A0ABQ9NXN6_9PEZI|nr:hypothetical protein H2199_007088 [Cladosporium sp. JES 115]KAJ9667156.1 hypothetical protein H2201_002676 [Coniosporium apollinis]
MPFRERMKKAFKRSPSNSETSSLSKTDSKGDPNVYQPGEKMPQPKYRRPVPKEHKEKLENFSFSNAWRRSSQQSGDYSPMGSRAPSRRGSLASVFGVGGRKSFQSRRGESHVGSTVEEDEGDDTDVKNVGLSKNNTHEGANASASAAPMSLNQIANQPSGSRPQSSNANGGRTSPYQQPFTQEDLTLALKRSHLDGPT